MIKTVLKFGLYGGVLILILFWGSYAFMKGMSYAGQEVLGYLSMFVSLLFVFFGIKSYRDKENGGYIGFGRAFGLGMLITLIPALFFGIFDALYVSVINPDFYENYAAAINQMSDPAQQAAMKAEMEAMKFFFTPFGTFLLMFITVVLMGIIVTLISSMVLRRTAKTA